MHPYIHYFTFFNLMLLSGNIWAAQQSCNNGGNAASKLHPSNTRAAVDQNLNSGDVKNILTPEQQSIVGSSLIKCNIRKYNGVDGQQQMLAGTKTATFNPFFNSNISSNMQKTFNGKSYYKIVNTSNKFINDYAYIYFSYSDNTAKAPEYTLNEPNGNIRTLDTYTQGLKIHNLSIAFDKAPIQPITNVPIKIGSLDVAWTRQEPNQKYYDINGTIKPDQSSQQDASFTTSATQVAQIRLNITPYSLKTCNVNSPNVVLPTMSTHTLKNVGDTAGKTNFTVKATCTSGLENTLLYSTIVDNQDVGSSQIEKASKGVLINAETPSASKNVAIQIFDAKTNMPVTLGVETEFGTTSQDKDNPIASRGYYAKYYKLDSANTSAGTLNSTATVTVMYK
ncbi:fimbrial protein [Acinetobacter sp. MD2(2019)]|uniref:fimbrial protein n=1 Tax=Acinetobacter sp. MD2(2019) TaxID=2605273 RepID=UPI002D1EF008|nr:fimbrial protein [Acinetobacter sp. MD2(2019)]MEB3754357.1 fimbrial protein [Acinetobacter sp. MD2(2019)]